MTFRVQTLDPVASRALNRPVWRTVLITKRRAKAERTYLRMLTDETSLPTNRVRITPVE